MVFSNIVNAAGKRHARSAAPTNKNAQSSCSALSKSNVPIFNYKPGNQYSSIGTNKRRKIENSATHSSGSTVRSTQPPAQARKRKRDCFDFDELHPSTTKKRRTNDLLFNSSGTSDDEEAAPKNKNAQSSCSVLSKSNVPIFNYKPGNQYSSIGTNKCRGKRHARSAAPKNKNAQSSCPALSKSNVPIFNYKPGNQYSSIGTNKRRKIENSATHSSGSTVRSTQPPAQARKRERDCFDFDELDDSDLFNSSGTSDDEKFIQRKSQLPFDGTQAQGCKKACIQKDEHLLAMVGEGSESSGSSSSTTSFKQDIYNVVTLIGAQALLIPIAIFIAKFLNLPNSGLGAEFQMKGAILDGVKFTLPLFGIAGLLRLVEPYSNALQNVTKATQRSVLSVLGSTRRPFFALFVNCISGAIAGIGEEWLFRGVFQELLAQKFQSPSLSLALSGLVFGLLHAFTPVYAILAGAASVFFGYLYIISHNLAVPMITHAVYDVFALMWAHISVTALEKEEIDEILNFSSAPVLTANTFKEGHLDVSEEETDGDKGGPKIFNA